MSRVRISSLSPPNTVGRRSQPRPSIMKLPPILSFLMRLVMRMRRVENYSMSSPSPPPIKLGCLTSPLPKLTPPLPGMKGPLMTLTPGSFIVTVPTALWILEMSESLVTIKLVSSIKCPVVSLAMRGPLFDVYVVHPISG